MAFASNKEPPDETEKNFECITETVCVGGTREEEEEADFCVLVMLSEAVERREGEDEGDGDDDKDRFPNNPPFSRV